MAEEPIKKTKKENPDESSSKKTKPDESKVFDTKNLSDEDFQKFFDDERAFQHPRFKQLNERAKKAADLEKAQEEAERKSLEKQNKFKELYQKEKSRNEELAKSVEKSRVDNAIQAEAAKYGAKDLGDVLALLDRSTITVGEDGNVTGVTDAVKAFSESKPHLFGETPQPTVGAPTSPGSDVTSTTKFKMSQVQDPEFYREHADEIDKAIATGNVEIDVPV